LPKKLRKKLGFFSSDKNDMGSPRVEGSKNDDEKAKVKKKKKKANRTIKGVRKKVKPITVNSGPKDKRFRTDVMSVRKSLRTVYRSVPFEDFVKMINYIQKCLRYMRSERLDTNTYWHADDPLFDSLIGQSSYAVTSLLPAMGFVLLNETYWVWPGIHLKGALERTWGLRCVPKGCLGLNPARIDDIILLLRHCQAAVQRKGEYGFNGFFK